MQRSALRTQPRYVPPAGDPPRASGAADGEPVASVPGRRSRGASAADRKRKRVEIAPEVGWPRIDLAELWAFRGLALFLVWRDLKVRYAQTVFGVTWAVLQPVLAMVVFTIIFGHLARIPSEGVPYPVFSLAAVVPWTYFAGALSGASNSLIANPHLITKVYCPRLLIPVTPALAALTDFAIAFVVLLLVMAGFRIVPSPAAVVVVPLMVLIALMTALGVGFLLAALNIQYRDVRHGVPFLIQVWMYGSPIVYPASLVPAGFRTLYELNPMVGVVAGFRAVLLHAGPMPWRSIGIAAAVAVFLLAAGALFFRRRERVFADVA